MSVRRTRASIWSRLLVLLLTGGVASGCAATPAPSEATAAPTAATATAATSPAATTTAATPPATTPGPTRKPTPTVGPTTAAPTPAPSPVPHRIGVRVVDGAGEFFDRETGARFTPRGVNYIRLAGGHHSTLDVGRYDPAAADTALARMAADGYNTVRVFLNTYPGGLPGPGSTLSAEYLDNVADFLARAAGHGLFVIPTLDWLPESPGWSFSSDPGIENVNSLYLSTRGVTQNERFFAALARGLVERGARLDALLAYELRNELYFTDRHPPFSLRSGSVTTANGRTYDVSAADERTRLLEENLVAWIDRMRAAILAEDPTALVTVGFFQPQGPNPSRIGDDRLIETEAAILRSTADFIDIHGYPGGELTLRQVVENFKLPRVTAKPILMGEFGAEHGAFPTADDAVRALVTWQIESCGYGIDGWLQWTWDTTEQPEFWNALDADGALERALSPAVRPDPCALGELDLSLELSREATARASSELGDSPAAQAIDGLAATIWNAGAGPTQRLEIDLGARRTVEAIRLLVAQDPSGATAHAVLVRGGSGAWREVAVLTGTTSDGDWLEVRPKKPLTGIRFVRIETRKSPSWVAWREVSVLGR